MPKTCLLLFSSNQRALYAQDVSNAAATPAGSQYRFRYQRRWVGDRARNAWAQDQLAGTEALVVFSFQHHAHFHPPAFVPVRKGRIIRSAVEGSVYIIDFELGDYVVLLDHEKGGAAVRDFSRRLERLATDGHPGAEDSKSAGLAPPIDALLESGLGETESWERTVRLLNASGSFPEHLFFRVVNLSEAGSGNPLEPTSGQYRLTAGRTYELSLFHYQPTAPTDIRHLEVVVDDEVLDVHGSKQLTVSSGYDILRFRFHVSYRDEPKETTLSIESASGEHASRCQLSLHVVPPKGEKGLRIGVGTAAITAAALPSAVATFDGRALMGVIGLIVIGGFTTGWLNARSRIRIPKLR